MEGLNASSGAKIGIDNILNVMDKQLEMNNADMSAKIGVQGANKANDLLR